MVSSEPHEFLNMDTSFSSIPAEFRHSYDEPSTEVTPLFWGGHIQMVQKEQRRWKDGLCDCFRFGVFHASVWNALCCPTILMGQVLTRLDMTFLATSRTSNKSSQEAKVSANRSRAWSDTTIQGRGNTRSIRTTSSNRASGHQANLLPSVPLESTRNAASASRERVTAFTKVFILTCLFWTLATILLPSVPKFGEGLIKEKIAASAFPMDVLVVVQWVLFGVLIFSSCVYTLVVLTRLRQQVRRLYEIPASSDSEDCYVSTCCLCCSVAQLARQTCDYEEKGHRACCCSPTGLGMECPPISSSSSFTLLTESFAHGANAIGRAWPSSNTSNEVMNVHSGDNNLLNHSF